MFISTDLLVVSPAHIISTIVIKVVPADEIEWMYDLMVAIMLLLIDFYGRINT